MFGFLSVLLQRVIVRCLITVFYLCESNLDRQDRFDQSKIQIMVVTMLKNWSCRYSNHNIIKFVGFIPIYYVINFDIISSYMVHSY